MNAIEIYTNPVYGTRAYYARTEEDTWPGETEPLGEIGVWYGTDQHHVYYGDGIAALANALNNTLYTGHLILSCERIESLGWTLSDSAGEVYLRSDEHFKLTYPRQGRGYVEQIGYPFEVIHTPVYLEVS